MAKPRITARCNASHHEWVHERIIEFSFPDTGDGGLISFRTLNDGTQVIDIYATDGAAIDIRTPQTRGHDRGRQD